MRRSATLGHRRGAARELLQDLPLVGRPQLRDDAARRQQIGDFDHARLSAPRTRRLAAARQIGSMPPRRSTAVIALSIFSRRRCTDDGMRIASRYLATVRRAMSTPSSCSSSTMRSSDSVVVRRLAVDQAADAEAHRLGRMRLAAARGGDRRGEEILQLEQAARRRDVFVGGHPADRAFVHADRVGDVAQDQRPQRLHAVAEKPVLLPHDLGRDLEDRRGALVQRFDQPVGRLQPVGRGIRARPCCGPRG